MSKKIELNFQGPFNLKTSSCPTSLQGQQGIVLWTIKMKDSRLYVSWISSTTNFGHGDFDDLEKVLHAIRSLEFGIIDPERAKNGIVRSLWKGTWWCENQFGKDSPTTKLFLEMAEQLAADEQFKGYIEGFIDMIDIWFVPVNSENNRDLHIALNYTVAMSPAYSTFLPLDTWVSHFGGTRAGFQKPQEDWDFVITPREIDLAFPRKQDQN